MMADEPSHHLGRVFMSYMSQILRLSPEFSIAACTAGQKSLNARSMRSVFPDVLYSLQSQYDVQLCLDLLAIPSVLVFSGSWNSEDGAKAHMFMILSSPQGYATKRRSGAAHSTNAPGVSIDTRSVLGSARSVSFDTNQRMHDFPTAYGWTSPTIRFRVKD